MLQHGAGDEDAAALAVAPLPRILLASLSRTGIWRVANSASAHFTKSQHAA
jgi:hypothetical protein